MKDEGGKGVLFKHDAFIFNSISFILHPSSLPSLDTIVSPHLYLNFALSVRLKSYAARRRGES